MRTKRILVAVACLLCFRAAFGEVAKTSTPVDLITVFKVPLVCPAARQIGCGSRAKPILLALERERDISAAWLNRPGTLLAIVWRPKTPRKERRAIFKDVSQREGLEARELTGAERKKALEDFRSGQDWLRGDEVDQLSEEEARIMTGRLIRKIRSLVALTDQQVQTLGEQCSGILKRRLLGEFADDNTPRQEILKALREQLSEKDVLLLQDALKDYRPGRDEP